MSTWKIYSYDASTGRGAILGAHIGPLSFGPDESHAQDYRIGESVNVEFHQNTVALQILRIAPVIARQPPGTELPLLAKANGFLEYEVLSLEDGQLTIGASSDLVYGHQLVVIFSEVSFVQLAPRFSHALFRLASPQEVLDLPAWSASGGTFYCIVTDHGDGPDGPAFFIAAERVRLEELGARRP